MNFKYYYLNKLTKTCTSIKLRENAPKKLKPIKIKDMSIKDIEHLVSRVVIGGYVLPSIVDKLLLEHYNNR